MKIYAPFKETCFLLKRDPAKNGPHWKQLRLFPNPFPPSLDGSQYVFCMNQIISCNFILNSICFCWLGIFSLGWTYLSFDHCVNKPGNRLSQNQARGRTFYYKRRSFYNKNIQKCTFYKKGPTFDEQKRPCQEHSRDEHRILVNSSFSERLGSNF